MSRWPRDWGARTTYIVDADPAIIQFEANIRLNLILVQILALLAVDPAEELSGWRSEADPAEVAISQLHCVVEDGDQLELPMPDAPLRFEDDY